MLLNSNESAKPRNVVSAKRRPAAWACRGEGEGSSAHTAAEVESRQRLLNEGNGFGLLVASTTVRQKPFSADISDGDACNVASLWKHFCRMNTDKAGR